jgi:hypothetical protein
MPKKTKKNKKIRKRRGGASPSPVEEIYEAQQLFEKEKLLNLTSQRNTYRAPYNTNVGKGSFKKVYKSGWHMGKVIINALNENMKNPHELPNIKDKMLQDYRFTSIVSVKCGKDKVIMPTIEWQTPHKLVYSKPECVPLVNKNLTLKQLNGIIHLCTDLAVDSSFFTLDLKPENVCMYNGKFALLDTGANNSFFINAQQANAVQIGPITSFQNLSLLILFLYCYNYANSELQNYIKGFYKDLDLYQMDKKFFTADYDITTDPDINLQFNRVVAPLHSDYLQPLRYITDYGNKKNKEGKVIRSYAEIIDIFNSE